MSIELPEWIRKKEFKSPMNSENMKHYTEQLALSVLRYCFDEYDDFLVKDAPDLQNPDCMIGLEVTEAAVSKNRAIDGDYLQYRKTKDVRYLKKIQEKGGTATDLNYSVLPVSTQDELDAIGIAFQKKLKKITKYKNSGFTTLRLIIVLTEPPIPYTVFEWGNLVFELNSQSEEKFEKIFLTFPSALSILDCNTGAVNFNSIPTMDYDAIKKYARIMAEQNNY